MITAYAVIGEIDKRNAHCVRVGCSPTAILERLSWPISAPVTTVRIPWPMMLKVNRHAEKTGGTRSDVIKNALACYLGAPNETP